MRAKRAKWKELNLKAKHDNLVFLYESGVNINMTRRYGRAINRGDIVVMDNMRSHHVAGVKEALRAAGVIPLYLPPYSPDLNPIEMMWSKMKPVLRKTGCRTAALLPQVVIKALSLVYASDCMGWFAADAIDWIFEKSCSVSLIGKVLFVDAKIKK